MEIKTDLVYKFDQFFTKEDVAKKCYKVFCKTINVKDFDCLIEPSAGEGSFFKILPEKNRVAIEIDENLCKLNKDYLNLNFLKFKPTSKYKKNIVIGNPPFGTQNKLSVDFFNHAATFSEVIAFIVPKTWNKQSIQDRLDKNFHLIKSVNLQKEPFYGEKKTDVKCCFQIWKKSNLIRVKKEKILYHNDWDFIPYIKTDLDIEPPQKADFVVLAYGSNPGQISEDLYKWRPKSVHFIKSKINKKELMDRLSTLDYSCANDSARQSSLCKADLVKLYTEKYGV